MILAQGGQFLEVAARYSILWAGAHFRNGFLLPSHFCLFTTAQGKGLSWAVPKVSRACQPTCPPSGQHFLNFSVATAELIQQNSLLERAKALASQLA